MMHSYVFWYTLHDRSWYLDVNIENVGNASRKAFNINMQDNEGISSILK
jgi:hypothetical protein